VWHQGVTKDTICVIEAMLTSSLRAPAVADGSRMSLFLRLQLQLTDPTGFGMFG
jgi:hypothetical protein